MLHQSHAMYASFSGIVVSCSTRSGISCPTGNVQGHSNLLFSSRRRSGYVSAKKSKDVTELQIGVTGRPKSCDVQAHKGDRVKVHYRGKLTYGTVFDSSFERGDPIEFELGSGQVIRGWDQGLLGMCVGEKRKLKIPAKLGYGDQGSPPTIPGGATLLFDTELVGVNGKSSSEAEEDNEL